MGAILSDFAECSPVVAVEPSMSDSKQAKTAVSSQNKEQTKESDIDTNEFVSQFGSYFSITPPSESAKSIVSISSSSFTDTTYDDASTCTVTNTDTVKPKSPQQPPRIHLPLSVSSDTLYTVSSADPYSNSMSPVSPCSPSFHRKSSTHHNDHEFKLGAFNGRCQVASCKAIKRIIKMLKWHSMAAAVDNNYEMLIQKVMSSQYDKYLLDDYQHIFNDHLFELQSIRKELNKQIEPCDVSVCVAYQRYDELVTKDLSQCDDATFCLDLMQLIHCYIVHSTL
eukprot:8645_1